KSREYANELFKQCLEDIYGMTCNHGIMIDLLEKVIKRVN
ncbi:MAG TPA: farnesyl-diphosphate synthase, partial [Erysipelotrichaceae bacterium]|nr:farnesyl-diphosphate synthase [Erysipelotrichaceae bacterium]